MSTDTLFLFTTLDLDEKSVHLGDTEKGLNSEVEGVKDDEGSKLLGGQNSY